MTELDRQQIGRAFGVKFHDDLTVSEIREPCRRCGHPSDWHRLDDSTNVSPTDPAAEFRCLGYDCEAPGPPPPGPDHRACSCPDYVVDG